MPENDWNPELYDQKHAFIFEYGKGLLSVLAPRQGERILDLGCGTGHLTQAIAASGTHVVGIDISPEMIAQARISYPDIEFLVADARAFFSRISSTLYFQMLRCIGYPKQSVWWNT